MLPARAAGTISSMALVGVIGWPQETNVELAAAWRDRGIPADLVNPALATCLLGPGDVAVGRLDVRRTLDGVEPGLEVLSELAYRGVRVLNHGKALLRAHDKLLTAAYLERAGVRHPRTVLLEPGAGLPMEPPFVLKPRFGSWGVDVFRCGTRSEFELVLAAVADRPWFLRHGALLQELMPAVGHDLRLIVAGGQVVGSVRRVAAAGEWRTNTSLGGLREPVERVPEEASRLGLAAAAALEADLVGVDLQPVDGGFVVLELNGAVEFDELYNLPGRDVYLDAARALAIEPARVAA
jgi:[lysine-biosynthesis-protein LysW]--L-2-aminoadipate ligase